jgi:hypothetical protein
MRAGEFLVARIFPDRLFPDWCLRDEPEENPQVSWLWATAFSHGRTDKTPAAAAESTFVTPELAAAAAARPIGEVEDAWSTDRRTLRRARELRISSWEFAVIGRCGVMGDDAHPETVAAAFGLTPPDALRGAWEATGRVGPAAVASARLAECAEWGRARLAAIVDERLVELLERVVTNADDTAMPIFAATRRLVAATDAPDDAARAALAIHTLAEYRTAAMVIAGRVVGLSPMEIHLGGPEGEQEAVTYGWSPPFPSRLSVLRRFSVATALADRMTGGAYAQLTGLERRELVDRLSEIAAVVRSGPKPSGAVDPTAE